MDKRTVCENRIFEVEIEVPLLMNGSEILLYMAQTPPPSAEQIFKREAAPETMPFLESLFQKDPVTGESSRLEAMAPSRADTALVLIPECAITMANWERVDELVRGLTRTAIVIGGLGYASSAELKKWKEAQSADETATKRVFGFNERDALGTPNMFFNTACSWIHYADGRTSCVVSLKNFLEQREEALKEEGLEEGSELLCLSAPDLAIYPLICAEFTCTREGDRPLDRVARDIPGESVDRRFSSRGSPIKTRKCTLSGNVEFMRQPALPEGFP